MGKKKKEEDGYYEEALKKVRKELNTRDPWDEDYETLLGYASKLEGLNESGKKKPFRPSADAVLQTAAIAGMFGVGAALEKGGYTAFMHKAPWKIANMLPWNKKVPKNE